MNKYVKLHCIKLSPIHPSGNNSICGVWKRQKWIHGPWWQVTQSSFEDSYNKGTKVWKMLIENSIGDSNRKKKKENSIGDSKDKREKC